MLVIVYNLTKLCLSGSTSMNIIVVVIIIFSWIIKVCLYIFVFREYREKKDLCFKSPLFPTQELHGYDLISVFIRAHFRFLYQIFFAITLAAFFVPAWSAWYGWRSGPKRIRGEVFVFSFKVLHEY